MHVQIVCVLRSFHQATHRQGNSRFTQNQKCFGQIGMSQNWWNCYRLPSDLISLVFSFYGLSVSIVMFVSATTKFTIPISHHAMSRERETETSTHRTTMIWLKRFVKQHTNNITEFCILSIQFNWTTVQFGLRPSNMWYNWNGNNSRKNNAHAMDWNGKFASV